MFLHYKTQGIVVKKENRGESDRLFTVYTKNFGKIEISGKAIRKISSKLRSAIDVFYLSELEFIQAKNRKTLTDAILIDGFKNLKEDLSRWETACRISKLIEDFVRGQEPDQKIWELLLFSFKKLNGLKNTSEKLSIVYYYFFWNFISFLGYSPDLHNCANCRKKITPENIYFDSKSGGLICESCFSKIKKGREIKIETVKLLRIILKMNWEILSRIKIKEDDLGRLESLSKNYYSCVLTVFK
jgi:DNA repair protein RecO (recombination protein O)